MVDRGLDDDEQSVTGLSTALQVRFDPTDSPEQYTLTVIEGPDKDQQLVLDAARPSRSLIGTSPACELRLTDRTVSRRHAAFELDGEWLRVTDLGSKNRTIVNGTMVLDAHLGGGERVQLGTSTLSVKRSLATPPQVGTTISFGSTIGASLEMRRLYPLCERLATADIPLLIEGETGTGKEVLAQSLHDGGPRAAGPFVIFDCTTAAPTLLESELFGHQRGAFTGATQDRVGLFEQADGGTLFVDEIGDLDIALQAKLLRVIDSAQYRRVGSNDYRRADVRIIAATRRDLDQEISAGRFRDDLYHRLAVGRIELPPLRKRRGDVWVLCRHFATGMGQPPDIIPADLLSRWDREIWPGNVRELKNAVARHVVLGDLVPLSVRGEQDDGPDQGPDDLVEQVLAKELPLQDAREEIGREFSRRYLRRALEAAGGNVSQAARASGVSRRYLHTLKAKLGE